tara:strand:- start:5531 stop:6061 length:531 start_codon:yes stop_codon:yes gene_type:complete
MAIQVTTLKGTNSLSADRITINDNFSINTSTINDLLGILNTTTGKFDNTSVGVDNTITTDGITIKDSGIDIQKGNLNITDGIIILPKDGAYIELGADGSKIVDKVVAVGANSTHIVGVTGFIAIEVPKMSTVELTDVGTNGLVPLGATGPAVITYDTTVNKYKGWNLSTQSWDLLS